MYRVGERGTCMKLSRASLGASTEQSPDASPSSTTCGRMLASVLQYAVITSATRRH